MRMDIDSIKDPGPVSFSLRVYRVLLRLYPSNFRQEYGSPMLQVFGDCCRRAYLQAGASGLSLLWLRTLGDLIRTSLDEHIQGVTDMSREKLIRLAAWAFPVGGLAMFAGFLANTRPEYNPQNFASLPIDRYLNQAELPLFIFGMLLVSFAMIGLLLHVGERAGRFAGGWLVLGAASGVVSMIGAAGLAAWDSEPWWSMFFGGMLCQFLSLSLFGVTSVQKRLLGGGSWLPLVAAIWLPVFFLLSSVYELLTGRWLDLPDVYFIGLFALTTLGLVLLGRRMLAASEASAIVQSV